MAEFLPLCIIISVPFSVHAGVFSSLLGVLNDGAVISAPTISQNSATEIKLLSSITNPDPAAALGGGDLLVEDGSLVAGGLFGADEFDESLSAGEISVYVVREGDSLSQIAQMFDVTTNTILWANDISKATAIQPGDTLVILPIVGVRHVVKSGDTISTIAKKYEGDSEEILAFNQLTVVDELSIGDIVIVPGGNMHQAVPKRVATRSVSPTKTSGSVASSAGYFNHPLPGAVRTQGLHGYNAVDLAASVGTPIRAAAAGEVIISRASGWNGGYGTYVVIKHANGSQTLYAHNSSNTVGVGARVSAGEVIGYVGSTGRSTGAHLHFEVRGSSNPF